MRILNWFRRKSPAPVEAVRDFVDTVELINGLLAKEKTAKKERDKAAKRSFRYRKSAKKLARAA